MLSFAFEIETKVTAEQGRIWIEQFDSDGHKSTIELTVRQFMEIFNQHERIVDAAVSELQ